MDDLKLLLDYIEGFSASVWITLCAIAVGYVCLRAIYSANESAQRPWWAVPGVVICLFVVFSAQGLRWWYQNTLPTISPYIAFQSLQENKRVNWLIRLIPYSRSRQNSLSIHELKSLGPPEQEFVFVADYDEVKNLTVTDAVYKSGLSMAGKDSVSAIIFPLNRGPLYPASARGLLQVIAKVDEMKKGEQNYHPFDLSTKLDPTPFKDLSDERLFTWAWSSYSKYYNDYLEVVTDARRSKISALQYIGSLGQDWHPLGYSQNLEQQLDKKGNFELLTNTGDRVEAPNFGVRAFLLENMKLSEINDIALIRFDRPDKDRIPDFGGRRGELPPF